ncbi:ATP-binding protein [Bdellovibrionota bacterium FG-2]
MAALISVAHNSPGLPEDSRVQLREAANRIRDIANQLLEKNREKGTAQTGLRVGGEPVSADSGAGGAARLDGMSSGMSALSTEERSTQLLSAVLESAISSKRLQYADNPQIKIESHTEDSDAAYGLFATLQSTEFSRVVSNLINNAVEAFSDAFGPASETSKKPGCVDIFLRDEQGSAVIEVRDNGKGIPPHLLAKIGVQGETHGKAGGSGLGVYHAKNTIESWGGRLEIESQENSKEGTGTTVRMKLPKAAAPGWFAPKIPVEGVRTIVVLDDDPGIHKIWEMRLAARVGSREQVVVLHFYSAQEILKWYRGSLGMGEAGDSPLYLCDYELVDPQGESKETGLDVIEKLGIASQSILVTSRYDEPAIQERCVRFGAKLLLKGLAHRVPLG